MKPAGWLLVLFAAVLPAEASEVSAHARKAVAAIAQLRAIPVEDAWTSSGPPARVPALLRTLNRELRALLVEDLSDPARRHLLSENDLFDQLRAAGWDEIPSHKWNAYGEIRSIHFDWKNDFEPALLVVSTELWLPCGSTDPDSAIYVFRQNQRRWDLVLATESDFDPVEEDPASGMQYRLSPPDEKGDWFMVVGHIPPSCRATETVLRYKALRPGADPDKPALIASGREAIDDAYHPPFRIRAGFPREGSLTGWPGWGPGPAGVKRARRISP